MNELQTMLADTANRLFTDKLTKQVRIAAEEGEWPQDLWNAVEENGFPRVLVSEAHGGAGAQWPDALVLLKSCGTHAVPLPLAETILANWFLDQAGIDVPDGPITFASAQLTSGPDGMALAGPMQDVPFAANCTHVVALSPSDGTDGGIQVALFASPQVGQANSTIARESVAEVSVSGAAIASGLASLPLNSAMLFGALARSAAIAGALQSVLLQAVQYAGERVQFGRPISKFQAVQHQLAELATHAASVGVAVDAAARAVLADPNAAEFDIAAAKVRASDAAQIGASIAHQTHGAIGFTYEHGLHFWTRRLWSWGPEYGGAAHWAQLLGKNAIEGGGHSLWATVTAR